MTALPRARSCQVASATSHGSRPAPAKSTMQVVPPQAAAKVPDPKSSADVTAPTGSARVDVDPARDHVGARGVNDPGACRVQIRPDLGDPLAVDENVSPPGTTGVNDRATP